MQRMGMVIGLLADKVAEYKTLHAAPWPEMNAALKAAHGEIFEVDWWRGLQARLRAGDYPDTPPYPDALRLA